MQIKSKGRGLPSRTIFYGVEGVGKTSWAAQSPKPIFMMIRGETGLETLIDNNILKETDHFDEVLRFPQALDCVRYLIDNDTGHRTLVIDTIDKLARLESEYVCERNFSGSWAKMSAYGKAPENVLPDWISFFQTLDALRITRKMGIILLGHTQIKTFKNPEGEDYDRYQPTFEIKQQWDAPARWADMILFANHVDYAKRKDGELKAKGVGSGERAIYTEHTAAYDAKNRIGLPSEISMGDSAEEGYANFVAAVKEARANGAGAKKEG